MKKTVWALGYAAGMVGYILTEMVLAIVEDVKMPEQGRTARPYD